MPRSRPLLAWLAFAALAFFLVFSGRGVQAGQGNPFSLNPSAPSLAVGQTSALTLTFRVPPGAYLYRDAAEITVVDAGGLGVGAVDLPPGVMKFDEAMGMDREVWDMDATALLPLTGKGSARTALLVLDVTYQGCKANLCLMPTTERLSIDVSVKAPKASLSIFPAAYAASDEHPVDVAITASGTNVKVSVQQLEGWHINQSMAFLELAEDSACTLGKQKWPAVHERPDPTMPGATRGEYDGNFTVSAPVSGPPGKHKVKGTFGYQACKAELCKMPEYVDFDLDMVLPDKAAPAEVPPAEATPAEATPAEVTPEAATEPAVAEAPTAEPPEDAPPESMPPKPSPPAKASGPAIGGDAMSQAREKGMVWLVLFVFGAGFLVSLTPCVLPMVPITVGLIGARSASSRLEGFLLASTYVLGLAVVYTALLMFSALTGSIFGAWMQSPWVVGTVALFFAVMGASMFGAFELGVPSSIATRLNEVGGAGYKGSFLMGAVGALVAGPCSGPVIASLMVLIGQQGEVALGLTLGVAFSLGMGLIFLFAGTFSGAIMRPGAWMETVKQSFGVMMWLGAIYFVKAHLPDTVTALLTSAVFLGTAVFGWPNAEEGDGPVVRAKRLYGVVGVIVGGYLLLGVLLSEGFILAPVKMSAAATPAAESAKIAWERSESAALSRAKSEGKPIIIDFTAEWCAACKELEHFTYSDPAVVALSERFVPLMFDATSDKDPVVQETLKRYGVLGLPTVLFLDPNGAPNAELTLIGFEPADAFMARMNKALELR